MFFSEVDHAALGALFITAKPEAGLDWPVRLLVTQDESGAVWAVYTDFKWIAARHRLDHRIGRRAPRKRGGHHERSATICGSAR
jgi:uncharacterized protein DUF302